MPQKSIVLLIQISWKIDALTIVIVAEANQLTIVLHCEAVELFERMPQKGVQCHTITYSVLMRMACSCSSGDWELGS